MDNLHNKILDLVVKYKKSHSNSPNEVWFGEKQKFEFEKTLDDFKGLLVQDDKIHTKSNDAWEFLGLKVRFMEWADSSSFLKVCYNPHYELV